jgi:ADP-dependent NAD(P)H-hydrate dehydratase / NAD(P)H-hydrate epimerase
VAVTKIVSVAEMRALEAAAFAAGVSEAALQASAGRAVADEVERMVLPGQRVVVLVGHGNNGRDGALAATALGARGIGVELVLALRHAVTDAELRTLRRLGARLCGVDDQHAREAIKSARVAIDAISGIGIQGALREPLASMARMVNAAPHLEVVALDVPSGIDADSGDVLGDAVRADTTVTLGAVKQGLLRFPAAERVGRLIVRDIGIPPAAGAELPYRCLGPEAVSAPPRPIGAHKYSFGRVLVVAGSEQFVGAPVLCVGGALRSGAGLVTLATTRAARHVVAARLPEATYTRVELRIEADPRQAARDMLANETQVLVLGPGLGRSQATTALVEELLRLRPRESSLVVDADGLFALSEIADWHAKLGPNTILTPHAGELRRLVDTRADAVPTWVDAGRLATKWGCVLVAKGPFTSVACADGRVDVWPHANAALATGGTGDVLAGMCGGLLAQGCEPADAARLAVVAHALAGEQVVQSRGWRTLLASDLFEAIPEVLRELGGATRRR